MLTLSRDDILHNLGHISSQVLEHRCHVCVRDSRHPVVTADLNLERFPIYALS